MFPVYTTDLLNSYIHIYHELNRNIIIIKQLYNTEFYSLYFQLVGESMNVCLTVYYIGLVFLTRDLPTPYNFKKKQNLTNLERTSNSLTKAFQRMPLSYREDHSDIFYYYGGISLIYCLNRKPERKNKDSTKQQTNYKF